jgi:putative inorganic carbon (hco3(-)) transporter
VLAALYGWYQYFTIPNWDAFWVEQVGFVGYLGQLRPTEMWVFSTFPERGPCAAYLALVAIPVLVSRRWRITFGWPELLLLVSCIFLTMARVGIILVACGVVLYPIVNGGRGSGRILLYSTLAVALLFAGLNSIPGADRVVQRFATLGHMQDDGSFKGRVSIFQDTWPDVLKNPAGYGIGSSGTAGRLNGSRYEAVVSDNGWLELMTSLGWFGFALFATALALLWKYLSTLSRLGVRDDFLGLARTYLVATLIFTWGGNFFVEFTVMWIAIGRALSPLMLYKADPEYLEMIDGEPTVESA